MITQDLFSKTNFQKLNPIQKKWCVYVCIYVCRLKRKQFGLVWFYDISTIVGIFNAKSNLKHINSYIWNNSV